MLEKKEGEIDNMENMSIYESKCEILKRSLELVTDYICNIELGTERRFTSEDKNKCGCFMVVTVENADILYTFDEILSEKEKERPRQELIDLQHKYINLLRKEIGNKPLIFSKDDFVILRLSGKEEFIKEK